MASIVSECYDLTDPSLVKHCRDQLESNQICVLPEFLTESARVGMLEFVEAQQIDHPGLTTSTVYYQEPDEAFPGGHPKRRLVTRSNTYITADKIPLIPLRELQESEEFVNFLQHVTNEKLCEYKCEVSKFVFSLAGNGDHQDWHFDNNFFTLTFMLQKPAGGGLLEVHPQVGRDNYQGINEILDGEIPTTQTYDYELRDMVLFFGRDSLHRATPVQGDKNRVIAIISYNTPEQSALPDRTHMKKVYNL